MSDTPSASVTKKLRRLFVEIRREAKRNPEFAARLDEALSSFASSDDALEMVLPSASPAEPAPAAKAGGEAITINPMVVARSAGAQALRSALDDFNEPALRGLIEEHNLDPAGETSALAADDLIAHIVLVAERRLARDQKLFDY